MLVKKMKVINFKRFESDEFDFNDDINILVGDNNAGKSTVLEALEIALNFQFRGKQLNAEFSSDFFNASAVSKFLNSPKNINDFPEIRIEVFLSGVPEYQGANNIAGVDAQGVMVIAKFDEDYETAYYEYRDSGEAITSIPVEFYKIEWLDFAWNKIKPITKRFKSLYVDSTRIHPTHGKNKYISNVLDSVLDKDARYRLDLNYREMFQSLNNTAEVVSVNAGLDSDNKITEKKLSLSANSLPPYSLNSSLQLAVDKIPFHMVGKGEQSKVQIKLAFYNKSEDVDVIMMEEPENHLSHIELNKLIRDIDEHRENKQLFLTTHSSYVLNKLSIDKICLLGKTYKKLDSLDKSVVRVLKRLPGYDTLRVALTEKVVLVEGPSDELVIKKIYKDKHNNKLPEHDGIDVIVVRGVGFKTFIEIGKEIGTKINVLRDNDGDYTQNVVTAIEEYASYPNIKMISSSDNEMFSLEPALIISNAVSEIDLDSYAKIVLSVQTLKKYSGNVGLQNKKEFLVDWFRSKDGDGKGAKKVDSAIKLFDTDEHFKYPAFLDEVFDFA